MRNVFLSLCLTLCIPILLFAQSAKNDIPFTLLESGHLLVKARVDGVDGNFIFDTGAGLTVFTKPFFEKLKQVKKEDGGYTGFRATGERLDIDLYRVKTFEFGHIKKTDEEVSYVDANLGGIDGIISLKLVESLPFTIDFDKKVLHFESAKELAAIRKKAQSIPVQLEQSRNKALTIFSYFRINDTLHLQLSLDSGAGKEVFRLNAKYLQQLGVDVNDTLKVKKYEKKSEINTQHVSHIYLTKLDKIAAAEAPAVQRTDFPVQFLEGLIYDGIIWINWLGKQITFDLDNKVLLVQR
ncbi:retropepsin-like aspartic protease [Chitinophaga rhizophila]|uniref:Retroviral-like aspartic protease family protein n=1 Tax=Chitinophaga rhizophila TaxID=2866212 RepID=A0ABS7G6R7_9BACT|nr:retropepsin-like aspartic protease [Chitinophaga rhizophila]MBW8682980.1 retroviral-like aspartic protease family protein [Chitinophaga rhizophila]